MCLQRAHTRLDRKAPKPKYVTQRHKDTETQRHKDTKTQKHSQSNAVQKRAGALKQKGLLDLVMVNRNY